MVAYAICVFLLYNTLRHILFKEVKQVTERHTCSVCYSSLLTTYYSSLEVECFQKLSGIPMGTNSAELHVDILIILFESFEFLQTLVENPSFSNWVLLLYPT